MDTLSLVSKYLNGVEDYLDDGDSLEARKLTVRKSTEELELFDALEHKSVIVKKGIHRVVVFKKAPSRAWDAELDMVDSFNYITEERFDMLGFVRVDYGKYGRKMVKEVRVEIHGFIFLVDFVVIGYANKGDPLVIFGRDFLVTSKSRVDFRIGEMHIDLTMLEEMKDIDVMLDSLVEEVEMVKEALDRKYKELEESKPILEVLENYITYRKKLDEVMMGRARLSSEEYDKEEKMRIVEHGLPKKMCDLGNFVLPDRVNGTVKMSALADTRASDGNTNYGPISPSFLDIEDDMERALAMKAYFNPFKNIIVFKKLVDFLGLLPVQLKNTDWGNEGHRVYKKVKGDGAWHAKFEVITPSGRKFTRGFKSKETKRKLSRKFTSEEILKFDHFLD
ncbi:hypothetical protein Tco_0661540 [Tanacetum coccineum]